MNISMLLKEEVSNLNTDIAAGCERVFIEDIKYFDSLNILGRVYTAVRNHVQSGKRKLIEIKYPHEVLINTRKFLNNVPYKRGVFELLIQFIETLAQFYYAATFYLKEKGSNLFYTYQVPLVGLFAPGKTIVYYHNFYPNLKFLFKVLYYLQKNAGQIKYIFVSRMLEDQYLNSYPELRNNKNIVIHNAVDIKTFLPEKKISAKINFVYLSAWVKEKGIYMLPNIIRSLNTTYSNQITFTIGGSLNLWSLSEAEKQKYKKIESRIYSLEKRYPNVKVLGGINHANIPEILTRSTYTLLPSIWDEPNSLLASESIASGTPVIAFDVGGNSEIIQNGKNGFLVKDITEKSMVNFLKKLIRNHNRKKYHIMSKKARSSAIRYSQKDRQQKLISFILSAN